MLKLVLSPQITVIFILIIAGRIFLFLFGTRVALERPIILDSSYLQGLYMF